jgi:hypothetical protein
MPQRMSEELSTKMHGLERPEVTLPLRQQQLRRTLLQAHGARREGLLGSIRSLAGGMITVMMNGKLGLAAATVLLVSVLAYPALRPAQAAMFLTMQVNPAIELGLDGRGAVISTTGLDEAGTAALRAVDVRNHPLAQALAMLTDHLIATGQVAAGARVVIALRSVDAGLVAALPGLAAQAREVAVGRLAEAGIQAQAVGLVVDPELFRAARQLGFLPAAYAGWVTLGISGDTVLEVLTLASELGISARALREESGTLAAAFVDLKEAGLTVADALAVIRAAVGADPSLEESSTIAAAFIDLHEAGVPLEQGLAILALQREAGLEREAFLEEVATFTDALARLHKAGISGPEAVAILRAAAEADPELEEIDTIVAAMIELTKGGLAPGAALTRVQAALAADPSLERLEELLGIDPRDDDEADDADGDEVDDDEPEDDADGPDEDAGDETRQSAGDESGQADEEEEEEGGSDS